MEHYAAQGGLELSIVSSRQTGTTVRAAQSLLRIPMPFDIVLVDDHKLVRDGVKTILERGAEFHVVGEAENGPDAVELCQKSNRTSC